MNTRSAKSPVAVVDVGTNSALLLIATRRGKQLESLVEAIATPRLGEGFAGIGRVSEIAVDRLIETIYDYQEIAADHNADQFIVTGTRVFRGARNAKSVIRQICRRTGATIRILSAREEAEYAFRGALSGLPRVRNGVMVDVGGGSTELLSFVNRKITGFTTIKLGAVTLAETTLRRFCHISDTRLRAAAEQADRQFSCMDGEYEPPRARIIAVGGTVTTLAAMDLRSKIYRPDRVHGHRLTIGQLERFLERFRGMKISDLRRRIAFDPGRAAILPAGTFIWVEVLKHLRIKELTVSHRGLNWGVAEQALRTR